MKRLDSYMISATEPHQFPSGVHNQTIQCAIVAVDIKDAINAFQAVHPDATLWTVSHRGKIEVITSDAMETAKQLMPCPPELSQKTPPSMVDHIGLFVVLPDGGKGIIGAVCVSGGLHAVEYKVIYWYGGERREAWCERSEFQLVNEP